MIKTSVYVKIKLDEIKREKATPAFPLA